MDVERRRKETSALRSLFHEQLLHLIRLLGVDADEIPEGQDEDIPVAEAIDEIVTGTDVRVRAISHYQERLRRGTRKLLAHIDEIVDRLNSPIKLSRKDFIYNPQASSLLGSMGEVRRICDESEEIQRYLKSVQAAEHDVFYALLFMHYHEKEIFGDELRGEFIHRDVRQISVYFSGHRLMAPASTVDEVKIALEHVLLENVVGYLKMLLSGERRNEVQASNHHNLCSSMDTLNNPERYLDELVTILELPLNLVSLEENTVCVNKMGIKVSRTGASCNEIHLQEVEIGGNHNNILALVEIARSDIDV